MADAQAY